MENVLLKQNVYRVLLAECLFSVTEQQGPEPTI